MSTNNAWNNQITDGKSITLNSGTNDVNISTDTLATTLDIATGAAAKAIAIGSTDTTSTLVLNSGSGGIITEGISGNSVSNKNYTTINTSTGALGSDAGPAMVLISTQTASSSATLDFTTGISDFYGSYFMVFSLRQGQNLDVQMLFSNDGGSSYLNTGYQSGFIRNSWNNINFTNGNFTTTNTFLTFVITGSANANGYIFLHNLATSTQASYCGQFATGNIHNIVYGTNSATGINALRVQYSSGTIPSGYVSLYGIIK